MSFEYLFEKGLCGSGALSLARLKMGFKKMEQEGLSLLALINS